MNRNLLLGIDISTTSAKAIVIDTSGNVLALAAKPIRSSSPHPLWSEQEPEEWWTGVAGAIRSALGTAGADGSDIDAVGLTGQMHGLVLLDSDGRVLRPAILWNDQRTARQCDDIRERIGRNRLIRITGNEALTGFTAPKILWVAQNEPDVYGRVSHVLLPKDYIRLKLSGKYAMDKADGSGTLLFDIADRDWSSEVLAGLDIPESWLPPTFEGPEVTGHVSREGAEATGLRQGTPIVAGGGDQAAGAVGMGVTEPGTVSITLGTSGVVFAPTSRPLIEPDGLLHAFCHADPGRWHFMGVMLSAAGSLQWYRDTLAAGEDFADLVADAAAAAAGSDGLIFLPYLSGERTPYPDPLARGAWIGLTLRHKREHLTRALLEGVAFGLRDSFELLKSAGIEPVRQVRIAGGGARSPLWRQIIADVLGVELVSVQVAESAAFGAAILAGTGEGCWPDVRSACEAIVRPVESKLPDERRREVYDHSYTVYRSLYPLLKSTNVALSSHGPNH